jgi:hypothetical protein
MDQLVKNYDRSITYHGYSQHIDGLLNDNEFLVLLINSKADEINGGDYSLINGISEVDNVNIQILQCNFTSIKSWSGSLLNFDKVINGSLSIYKSNF